MINSLDLSHVKLRLEKINKEAAPSISFHPSEVIIKFPDFYSNSRLLCLEDPNKNYPLSPRRDLMKDWNIYAYDESVQDFMSLEGTLTFCSFAVIKIQTNYAFNLRILPFFITSMKKYEQKMNEEIRYNENAGAEKNSIIVDNEISIIKDSVEPHSIVLIDGPLIGRQASTKMVEMDREIRTKDCIPLYFVKNSNSRLIIDGNEGTELGKNFNSDFHWACKNLSYNSRSAFFKYTEEVDDNGKKRLNKAHSKVFTYLKALPGFPQRVEMHSETFEKYSSILPDLFNLIAYFYAVQGDFTNPQVRPIAIAEKYAREGLKVMNIPVLLRKLHFRPTINQARFG